MKKIVKSLSLFLMLCIIFTSSAFSVSSSTEKTAVQNLPEVSDSASATETRTDETSSTDTLSVLTLSSVSKDECMISEYVSAKAFDESKHVKRLLAEETLDTYVFQNEDGTKSVYYMYENVKFVDDDGKVKEKDVSLVRKDNGYGIVRNNVDLYIPDAPRNGIDVSYGGYDVKITPVSSVLLNSSGRKENDTVVYDGFFGAKTKLKYTPTLSGIKEDVVLEEYIPNASFDFILDTDGLYVYTNDEGSYLAPDAASKKVFDLGKVVVYDAVGRPTTGTMKIETVTEGKQYRITVSAPEEFLTDPLTSYPVTIDPTVTVSDSVSGSGAIEDAVLFAGLPNHNGGDYVYLSLGYIDTTYTVGRVAVKLPGLYNSPQYISTNATNITSVKFYCWDTSGHETHLINIHPITGPAWTESTATWAQSHTRDWSLDCGAYMPNAQWTEFNITPIVRGWKNGTYSADLGFMMSNSEEPTPIKKKAPYSSEVGGSTYKPYVVMTYVTNITLNYTSTSIVEGGTRTLVATTSPSGQTVSWSTSNSAIATVSSSGVVTAKKAGRTTITASYVYNGSTYSATCTVYVYMDIGVFYVQNYYSGYYLHVENGKSNNYTNVYQFSKYSTSTIDAYRIRQMWRIHHLGNGVYSIRPLHKLDMALDVTGTNADIYNIGTTDTLVRVPSYAQWEISWNGNGYVIKNTGSNSKTLQVEDSGTASGANVNVGSYTGGSSQKWLLERINNPPKGVIMYNTSTGYYISSASKAIAVGESKTLSDLSLAAFSYQSPALTNLTTWSTSNTTVATVDSNDGTVYAHSVGTVTITASANGKSTSYTLTVIPIPEGTYFIKNKETEAYVDIKNQSMQNGTTIHQWELHGGVTQKWRFNYIGDGYYSIESTKTAGYYLGVINDSTAINVDVVLRDGSLTDGMKWKIERTTSGAFKITAKTGLANDYVLSTNSSSSSNGVKIIQSDYILNNSYRDEWFCILMLPTNGYELSYDSTAWTGMPSDNNNCYAYAINNQVVEPTGNQIWFKQQPGAYYNLHRGNDEAIPQGYQSPASIIVSAVEKDFNKYNAINGTTLTFTPIERYEVCPAGTYKVALVVSDSDYHWYRQDADGLWSHKRGTTPVKRTDESGELIIDPMIADRDDYTTFVGFFAVKPWNNMYISSKTSEYVYSSVLSTTVSDELLSKVKEGMSYDNAIKMLNDNGIDIGSGTIIQQYQSSFGFLYTFEYVSTEAGFVISDISIGG